jgi:hypothetical protein
MIQLQRAALQKWALGVAAILFTTALVFYARDFYLVSEPRPTTSTFPTALYVLFWV